MARIPVALVIALLIAGGSSAVATPAPLKDGKASADTTLPPTLTMEVLEFWQSTHRQGSRWQQFKAAFAGLRKDGRKPTEAEVNHAANLCPGHPQTLRIMLLAEITAAREGKPAPLFNIREIVAVLDESERVGYLDPWLTAYLWRKTESVASGGERWPVVELFAKLHRSARLTAALQTAKPVNRQGLQDMAMLQLRGGMQQWDPILEMQGFQKHIAGAGELERVRKAFATANAGEWEQQRLIGFRFAPGSAAASVIRGGKPGMPRSAGSLGLGRLDLVETTPGEKPVLLDDERFGRIELPPGQLIAVRDFHRYLPDKAKAAIRDLAADVLAEKEGALAKLEAQLPVAASLIREVLAASPDAAGAAKLRALLAKFDDVAALAPQAILLEHFDPQWLEQRGMPREFRR